MSSNYSKPNRAELIREIVEKESVTITKRTPKDSEAVIRAAQAILGDARYHFLEKFDKVAALERESYLNKKAAKYKSALEALDDGSGIDQPTVETVWSPKEQRKAEMLFKKSEALGTRLHAYIDERTAELGVEECDRVNVHRVLNRTKPTEEILVGLSRLQN